jgi:tetratricopeptide (TPR) repeat protein
VVTLLIVALAFQPAPTMLRAVFEEELARVTAAYGPADARTVRAARDLGLFLVRQRDLPAARAALTRVVGAVDASLADVAELAAVSEPAEAEALWLRASASPDAAVAARSFGSLGDLRDRAGDRAGAIRCYRLALAREEAAAGRSDIRVAARLNTLALALEAREAVPLLERALRIVTDRAGRNTVEAASIQINLAPRLDTTGRREAAVRHAAEAVAIFDETLGPDHPRTVASRDYLRGLKPPNRGR